MGTTYVIYAHISGTKALNISNIYVSSSVLLSLSIYVYLWYFAHHFRPSYHMILHIVRPVFVLSLFFHFIWRNTGCFMGVLILYHMKYFALFQRFVNKSNIILNFVDVATAADLFKETLMCQYIITEYFLYSSSKSKTLPDM